jgi:hypothetical protein
MDNTRRVAIITGDMKLVHALIAKSLAETILVGALAIGFYLSAFPPSFHGWGEATPHAISGWVVNARAPTERLSVQLFIDGIFVASSTANQSRPDIVVVGWAKDEWHGYTFDAPSVKAGRHTARVYALHASGGGMRQTLLLVGDPILFDVDFNDPSSGLHKPSENKILIRELR